MKLRSYGAASLVIHLLVSLVFSVSAVKDESQNGSTRRRSEYYALIVGI